MRSSPDSTFRRGRPRSRVAILILLARRRVHLATEVCPPTGGRSGREACSPARFLRDDRRRGTSCLDPGETPRRGPHHHGLRSDDPPTAPRGRCQSPLPRSPRTTAASQTDRRELEGRDGRVIHPPVATPRFRFQELGDFWLAVSRLYPEKRIELQLEVFRRLPAERLVLVGGHAPGDMAERYVARLRPPPNVTLLGEIPDERLVDLYARCRGFLTTAVDEDFGITPVEAMAAGKCVLATDEGGYRETVVDGKTGFLLPPDPDRFAAKIRELDDSTLRAMKNDCESRASEFDESDFISKMRALSG